MKKGLKWLIGILVVFYLFGRLSGGGSSRSAGTRSAQQTAPVQQEQPAAEPVQQVQEPEQEEPVQEQEEPEEQPATESVAQKQEPEESQQEEPAEAEVQTEAQEPAESGIPGVSAEFKHTMDEYEAFFDDYVELMQMYKESNDVAMMGKYAEMMNQYVVSMQALENMDTESMTVAEQAYYIEVMSRISQKLLLASQ